MPSSMGRVVLGVLVVLIGALLATCCVRDRLTHTGEPRGMSLDEAVRTAMGGETLSHVHVHDLVVDCDHAGLGDRQVFAPISAIDPRWHALPLLRLEANVPCEATPSPVRVWRAPHELNLALGLSGPERIVLLAVDRPHPWSVFAFPIVLFGIGGLAIRRGLRPLDTLEPEASSAGPVETPTRDPFRTEATITTLLPRPLRVSPAWFARARAFQWGAGIVVGLIVLATLGWIADFTLEHVRRFRVWNEGVRAAEAAAEGERRVNVILVDSASFAVVYTDHDGRRHHGEQHLLTIGSSFDEHAPFEVRYDPEEPTSFATSWAVDAFVGELLAMILAPAVLLAVTALGITLIRTRGGEAALVREIIHAGGLETILRVEAEQEHYANSQHVKTTYLLRLPEGTLIERDRPTGKPVFLLDYGRREVLALRHPTRPDAILLLDPDLAPLDVPPGEDERVRARYRERLDASRV